MVELTNGSVFELSPANPADIEPAVAPLIIPGEQVAACFRGMREARLHIAAP